MLRAASAGLRSKSLLLDTQACARTLKSQATFRASQPIMQPLRSKISNNGRLVPSALRRLATEAAQSGNKVAAKPAGKLTLMVHDMVKSWNRLSWGERWLKLQRYLVLGGTVFSCVIVVQMFYKTTAWAVNITAIQAFKWGAITGAIATASAIMGVLSIRRAIQLRPDPVYRMVLKHLRQSDRVVQALGKPLKVGKIRTYRHEGSFPDTKLVMAFELGGKQRSGNCTVEVARNWRWQYTFSHLAVDVHGTGEHILLTADADRGLNDKVKGLA